MKQHEKDFIDMIAPSVMLKCKQHGWGIPSAIIAQAIKESVKSETISGLALTCFNYWGMKWDLKYGCDYKEYHTKEQRKDGTYYEGISKFCRVSSVIEGVELYFKFIEMNPRYKRVMQCRDYASYCKLIKECGWATALTYTEGLLSIIKRDNLTVYDSGYIPSESDSYIIGATYTLQSNLYIRMAPDGDKIDYYSTTSNAQLNAYTDDEGYSILKNGTRVTCKSVEKKDDKIWMQIPSGWVCAKKGDKIYII